MHLRQESNSVFLFLSGEAAPQSMLLFMLSDNFVSQRPAENAHMQGFRNLEE
jgi:hypothetical protein